MCLRGYFLAFNNCVEVGSFETGRELVGLFMGWTSGEMGFGRVLKLVSFLPVLVRVGFVAAGFGLVTSVFGLIPFLFGGLGFGGIHDVGDWGPDTAEMGWVRAVIDGSFDSF